MGNTPSRPDLKGFCFFNGGFVYVRGIGRRVKLWRLPVLANLCHLNAGSTPLSRHDKVESDKDSCMRLLDRLCLGRSVH